MITILETTLGATMIFIAFFIYAIISSTTEYDEFKEDELDKIYGNYRHK